MKWLLNYLGMSRKSFGIFLVITLSTCIYWFSSIKSVIYEPFRQALGVSNAQLGFLLGLIGFVQIFGYALLGWLQDLLPIRKLIAVDLWGYGTFALILGLVPHLPYWFLVLAFVAFGFFGDAIYWPTIQKSTKGLATEKTQAAAFSTQECIRSAIGLVLNACTLGLFTLGGSKIFGARIAMCAYPIFMMLFSFVVLRFIPTGGSLGELRFLVITNRVTLNGDELGKNCFEYQPLSNTTYKHRVGEKALSKLIKLYSNMPGIPPEELQCLIIVLADAAKVAAKYESVAPALIYKHVGAWMQTAYLTALQLPLSVCSLGGGPTDVMQRLFWFEDSPLVPVGEMVCARRTDNVSNSGHNL